MSRRIKRHELSRFLRESGEISVSLGAGATICRDVHSSASPLNLIWGRGDRPTIELRTIFAGSNALDESTILRRAQRVLEINRAASERGAWLTVTSTGAVGARAVVFLVDDEASEFEVDLAIDVLRDTIAKYEAEFVEPIDPAHQHRHRASHSPNDVEANTVLAELLSSRPSPHSIECRVDNGRILLSANVSLVSESVAAYAAAVSAASAVHRSESGQFVLVTSAPLFEDLAYSRRVAELAWRGLAFDLGWLPLLQTSTDAYPQKNDGREG